MLLMLIMQETFKIITVVPCDIFAYCLFCRLVFWWLVIFTTYLVEVCWPKHTFLLTLFCGVFTNTSWIFWTCNQDSCLHCWVCIHLLLLSNSGKLATCSRLIKRVPRYPLLYSTSTGFINAEKSVILKVSSLILNATTGHFSWMSASAWDQLI